ncbi:hypothetical protein OC846_006828 [Tilletia horrida]|uniref:Uncharacterized protein n=1 Tax=Tilletia horrida TaxID=155126 RepID=A0AAN6GMX2_9BASI|nr:hypothetical protein OC846_006828 [Tilletia horrida]
MSQPSQASSSDTASHPNETTTQTAPKYPNLQKVDKVLLFPSPREWRIPGVYWPEEEELPQPAPYVEEPRLPRVRPPSDNYEEQLNWYRNNPNGIYHEDIDSGGLIPHAGAHTPPPEYFEERARISAAHAANAAANRRLISPTSPQDLAGEPTTPPPIHESAPTRAYPARDGDITADAGEISPTPPQSLRSFPTTSPLIHRPVPTRAYRARGSDYNGAAEAVHPAQSSEPSAPTETAYPAQSFDHSVATEAAYPTQSFHHNVATETAYPAQTSEFSAPTEAAYSAGSNELSTASEVAYPAQSFNHNIASEKAYAAQSFDHNVATETAYPAQTSEFSAPTEAAYSAESNELSASTEAPPVAALSSRRFEKSRVIDRPEEARTAEAPVAQPLASSSCVSDIASDPTWPSNPPRTDCLGESLQVPG